MFVEENGFRFSQKVGKQESPGLFHTPNTWELSMILEKNYPEFVPLRTKVGHTTKFCYFSYYDSSLFI